MRHVAAVVVFMVSNFGYGQPGAAAKQPPPSTVVFLSAPSTQATEGSVYIYSMRVNVEGAAFALTSGPSGSSLSGHTINWTPTPQQLHTANQFTVTATYAASTAMQSWSVTPSGRSVPSVLLVGPVVIMALLGIFLWLKYARSSARRQ